MILNSYDQIIREHFDFSDRDTTKFIKYINESDQQSQLLNVLASALYEKIVNKCDKIDFGSIPRSRGDITKIDGYNNTVECINIIRRLVVEYKEDPSIVDIELTAIENMKNLRPVFIKAFNNNASFPMMYYNITTAAIQHSVSFLIAVTIQFVKDPDTKNIRVALDKAAYKDAESNMLLEQLAKLNKTYASGELEKLLRESIGGVRESVEADEFTEDTISATDDVTDTIEDAPEAESTSISDEEIDEDVTILRIANGEDVPEEEPIESPFADTNNDDQLAAGANNPDTLPAQDDEVESSPIMPINGSSEEQGTQSVDERKGSIVKGSYHRHPSANAGYGVKNGYVKESEEVVQEKLNGAMIKSMAGKIALGISAAATIFFVVIPKLRNLVYYIFAGVQNMSETLAIQANLIELNALDLQADENSNLTPEKKATVIEKQMKWAQKLRSWSQKIALKDKKASKDAKKDIDEDNKKAKLKDVKPYIPEEIMIDNDLF